MLIPQRISRSKFISLAVVAAAAAALTAYVLVTYFWGDAVSSPLGGLPPAITGAAPIETEFTSDVIGHEPYTKLRQHGQLPVSVGAVGRENPFAPSSNALLNAVPAAPTTTPAGDFLFGF